MVNNVCYINIIIIILHNNLIECKRLSNCGHFIYGTCSIFDKWHNWKEIWRFSLKAILTCQLAGLAINLFGLANTFPIEILAKF